LGIGELIGELSIDELGDYSEIGGLGVAGSPGAAHGPGQFAISEYFPIPQSTIHQSIRQLPINESPISLFRGLSSALRAD
jgi:hypothetical protein